MSVEYVQLSELSATKIASADAIYGALPGEAEHVKVYFGPGTSECRELDQAFGRSNSIVVKLDSRDDLLKLRKEILAVVGGGE